MSKVILDDLKKSGLSGRDSRILKYKYIAEVTLKKLTDIPNIQGYKIPYYDINKKPLDFYRVKLFPKTNTTDKFAKHPIKYWQPVNTNPHLYFPLNIDWKDIAMNPTIPIVITEGEKKAAKACKEGIPTIGLGGVWSFRSKKNCELLIDDFNQVNLKSREIFIIYDSDLTNNENVRLAQIALAKELTFQGAKVFLGYLPEYGNGKIGLDDYLLTHSVEDFNDLQKLPFSENVELFKINDEIAYIEDIAAYYHFKLDTVFNRDKIVNDVYPDRFFTVYENDKLKRKSTIKAWLEWPNKRRVHSVVYEPGKPRIINNCINSWTGFAVKPKKGAVKPFLDLLDHLCGPDKNFRKWFLQWLAYPIKHPGSKMHSAVVFWSLKTGVGKSFLAYIIGDIYGDNYEEVGQMELTSDYNGYVAHKQFILGEEITGHDKYHYVDRLKSMISREKVTINIKYKPTYTIRDCINYMFTSNHPDSFKLERNDRRYAIHEITTAPKPLSFYSDLEKWRSNGGPSHLMHYLVNNVDLSGFNPKAPAPMTASKEHMQNLSLTELDQFAENLMRDPDQYLAINGVSIPRDLYTVSELMHIFDPLNKKNTSSIALSKALQRASFRQLGVVMTKKGSRRLYAARNQDKWEKASNGARAKHYENAIIVLDEEKVKKKHYKKK